MRTFCKQMLNIKSTYKWNQTWNFRIRGEISPVTKWNTRGLLINSRWFFTFPQDQYWRITRALFIKSGVIIFVLNMVVVGGCEAHFFRKLPARFAVNKSRNKGLISVDRRTSLLSHVQYPVPSESSTKDLSLSVPERRLSMVLGRSLSLRVNTESGNIVAFQHGFWLRGVQSLSCRW